jgi:hypothetical protein
MDFMGRLQKYAMRAPLIGILYGLGAGATDFAVEKYLLFQDNQIAAEHALFLSSLATVGINTIYESAKRRKKPRL